MKKDSYFLNLMVFAMMSFGKLRSPCKPNLWLYLTHVADKFVDQNWLRTHEFKIREETFVDDL